MKQMMKQYKEETGKDARVMFIVVNKDESSKEYKFFTDEYVAWLEAQLIWRPTSEKPEKDGEYFVKFHYKDGEEGMDVCDFTNGEWYWDDIISWLPIPPVPEGK